MHEERYSFYTWGECGRHKVIDGSTNLDKITAAAVHFLAVVQNSDDSPKPADRRGGATSAATRFQLELFKECRPSVP